MVEVKVVEQLSTLQRPKGTASTESGEKSFLSLEVSMNVLKWPGGGNSFNFCCFVAFIAHLGVGHCG